MKGKAIALWFIGLVSALAVQAETIIIQDDFSGMSPGDVVSNSVPEIGSGEWGGLLVSDGTGVLRAPQATTNGYWACIDLPEFDKGDIVKISATVSKEDGFDWWGLGFANAGHSNLNFNSNSPWAVFRLYGNVTTFGGTNVFNSVTESRSSAPPDTRSIELIYDTGEETLTTIYDGEVVHDNEPVVTSGEPTLDYAFIAVWNPVSGGTNGTYVDDFEVSVIPERNFGTVVWDDFTGVAANGNISNSVPDVGEEGWSGSLVSDGAEFMRCPATSSVANGGTIDLPEFHPGDIISIKATLNKGDSADWWGLGFSDVSYETSIGLPGNTPWATFRPGGTVTLFGGPGTEGNAGSLTRAGGDVSGLFEVELIYDTGNKTVTTIFDKEVVHDNVAITNSNVPTLNYAFIYFRNAVVTGETSSITSAERFSVSVTPAALADCKGAVVFWDDFDTGEWIGSSSPEADVEGVGWVETNADCCIEIVNGALVGSDDDSLYNGVPLPTVGKYGVVSISARYKATATNSNWIGLGFGAGVDRLASSDIGSGPWIGIKSDGHFTLYGGDGNDNANVQTISCPMDTFVDVKLTYDSYSQTAATWFNGQMVHTNVSVSNSAGTPSLDYALLQIRNISDVSIDDFRVDILPRREPLTDLGTFATNIYVSQYGAFPDDEYSDVDGIRTALNAAKNAANKPAHVIFEEGTYILDDSSKFGDETIILIGAERILISGSNTVIKIKNPAAGFLRLQNCDDVIVDGFDVVYDPLPFTQGTVTRVSTDPSSFEIDLEIDNEYAAPTNWWFVQASERWGWAIDDNIPGRLRDYSYLHYFCSDTNPVSWVSNNVYTVPIDYERHSSTLANLEVGSRYALLARCNGASICSASTGSSNCTFRNFDVYSSPAVTFHVKNGLFINFINVNQRFQGDNLVTSDGGGFHLQHGRATWIENCLLQGMSDDAMNDYCLPTFVTAFSNATYTLDAFRGADFQVGDRLLFFNASNETILGEASIESIPDPNGTQVVLDSAVAGVTTATNLTGSINVYNTDKCSGLYVKDCDVRNIRRHGILPRGRDSAMVGSSFYGLGDDGIYSVIKPEYEGGLLENFLILDNVFMNSGFETRYQDGNDDYGVFRIGLESDYSSQFCSNIRICRNAFANWRNVIFNLYGATNLYMHHNSYNPSIYDEDVSENIVYKLTGCSDSFIWQNDVKIGENDVYLETNSGSNLTIYDW